ncbi:MULTISPECIES: hypothetical protein [Acidobacteriaceae]|uniref:hypothetical protein n=1 Tax=Acidobacteriaceae TaxID=204434 RepID=UPI00131D77B5|nr:MULTISPECIES: hypothetical protein [Acidobacteriaceae]MDW5264882.1 hypothetical protein [Edaphobacter sp.]
MTSKALSTAISLVALIGLSSALCAQQPKAPTLEEILQRLEANLNHYDAGVPSFFCNEHVISEVKHDLRNEHDPRNEDTVIDSVFRLKRTPSPNHTTTLVESREIKTVDGKPATSQDMDGPTMLRGWFEGGLALVSSSQTACMNYTLQGTKKNHPADPYIVRFATVLTPQNTADCLLQEDSKGRVFIDPASMQITHLELTTPHHTIIEGDSYRSPVIGKRELTIDYAPVQLDGQTFWMPSTITLHAISGSGSFHMIVWSFRATYRNYHKLEVKSRILPGFERPAH